MLGPARQICFCHMGQGPDDHEFAIVAQEFGWHAFEFAAKKHVQKESLQHVVAVMAQGQFVAAQLACDLVQNAAAQATAQTAHGLAFGNLVFHNRVSVLGFDVKRQA